MILLFLVTVISCMILSVAIYRFDIIYMWQSRVENERYSVLYFSRNGDLTLFQISEP